MKKSILLLALFLLAGCSNGADKSDNIVLFGVRLGDNEINAPEGRLVNHASRADEYEYKHTPDLAGKWSFFYSVRNGTICTIHASCEDNGNIQAIFDICRSWIKKNVPIDRIETDDLKKFSTSSKKINASCQIVNMKLDGDPNENDDLRFYITISKTTDRDNPDLSK